jgi:hypothetical protein
VALCDDLRISIRSRRYFDVILWPRLTALTPDRLERPAPAPGLRRRGPSLREIERLVTDIEARA